MRVKSVPHHPTEHGAHDGNEEAEEALEVAEPIALQ